MADSLKHFSPQSNISLSELRGAVPHRGSGAPARSVSHKAAILDLLRERGAQGVVSSELYDSPEKFGRSPRNRISELRKEGYLISGEPRDTSDWHYVLIRDNEGNSPAPEIPRPEAPPSVEWKDRPRLTGLPLWDEVRK